MTTEIRKTPAIHQAFPAHSNTSNQMMPHENNLGGSTLENNPKLKNRETKF